jgi:hypothetical protein
VAEGRASEMVDAEQTRGEVERRRPRRRGSWVLSRSVPACGESRWRQPGIRVNADGDVGYRGTYIAREKTQRWRWPA